MSFWQLVGSLEGYPWKMSLLPATVVKEPEDAKVGPCTRLERADRVPCQ